MSMTFALTGIAGAVAGSMLVIPAARRLVLGNVERDWLQDQLDMDHIDTDNVTGVCKDNSYFRVYEIAGIGYEAKLPQEHETLCDIRASVLMELHEVAVEARFFGIKKRRDMSFDNEWPTETLGNIGEAEQHYFANSFKVSWILLLSGNSYRELDKADRHLVAGFDSWRAKLLKREVGKACKLSAFLQNLVSGDFDDSRYTNTGNISGMLPASDIAMHRNGLIETHIPLRQLQRLVTVKAWPDAVSGKLIETILAEQGEIEICHICRPWTNAKLVLERQKAEKSQPVIGSQIEAAEIDPVLDEVDGNKIKLFHTQFQITLRARDEAELDVLTDNVSGILARERVSFSIETEGAAQAWFNRMPGGQRRLLRPLTISNESIAALWAFQNAPVGRLYSPYHENKPVRLFAQGNGQAYAFQFHVYADRRMKEPLGHYLVFAPSGSGKSTLLMYLLGGLAKFAGVRSYVFDSKEGTRFMTEAFGGQYLSIDDLALNPFDRQDSNEARRDTRILLKTMIAHVLDDQDKMDAAMAEIEACVNLGFDTSGKTGEPVLLNEVFDFAFSKQGPARRAILPWVTDAKGNKGVYGDIFNARRDSLGGLLDQSFLTAVNMNEFLDDPVLGPPVTAHITTAMERASRDCVGINTFFDEAANLLRNPGFQERVAIKYREDRKNGGCVGMAFQEPGALLKTGIADAAIKNTATLFFFPNTQANPEDYRAFNLNDEQIGFILRGSQPGKRQVLIVQNEAAVESIGERNTPP